MPQVREFAESKVTFDDRYSPIIIMIWEGRSCIEAAQWGMSLQQEMTEKLVAAGQRFVSISDARKARRPEPSVRKYWADVLSKNTPESKAATLATYAVFDSALMRGVMTAIGWLSEEARSITTVATLGEAIEQGLAELDAAGIARPRRHRGRLSGL
jgi:hypothetical protein